MQHFCLTNRYVIRVLIAASPDECVWGNRSIAPLIHSLVITWRRLVRFRPRPLYHQRHSPGCALNGRQGGSQSCFQRILERKYMWPLAGLEPRFVCRLVRIVVTLLSELLRLLLIKIGAKVVLTCVM